MPPTFLPQQVEPGGAWNTVEASLFAYCAVADELQRSGGVDISAAVSALLEWVLEGNASSHKRAYVAAFETIGAFAPWVSENPQVLQPLLEFVVGGLQHAEVQVAPSFANESITRLR